MSYSQRKPRATDISTPHSGPYSGGPNAVPSSARSSGERSSHNSLMGRVPPNHKEAEESILGGILLDNESIFTAMEILHPVDFYRSAHRSIYDAMLALCDKREPIDVVTLSQELRAANKLEECGGIEYLGNLSSAVPSAANVGYYAKLVRDMSLRRQVIHEATRISQDAFEVEGNVDDFLDIVEQRILDVAVRRISSAFTPVGEVVQESIKLVEKLYDQKATVTGVPTGFAKLDNLLSGLQPSDLSIIAARPSMGKTALALTICQYIGINQSGTVALFSLEMSKEQLVLRMLCSEAQVDNSKVRTGHLGERDFPRIVNAASAIAEAPIFIDDTPALSVMELRAKARRLHRENSLAVIVVDYLQLMRSPAYSHSREQEISDISRSLKALAKELNVPVVALSQLNRSVESRTDKRPLMSDLRESGAIEQDADIIMFIYRDEVYNPDSPDKGTAEIIVSKHRSGPTGTVRLAFIDTHTRFANLAEEDPSDFGEPFDASQSSSALAGGTGHSDLKHSDVGQAFEDDFF